MDMHDKTTHEDKITNIIKKTQIIPTPYKKIPPMERFNSRSNYVQT
jgi:hypothetical protein